MDHPWDECVLSHPKGSVYHHSAWIKVITSTYHYEPFLVASKDAKSGRTNGIAPFLFIHSWLTGKRLVSLPFTSYCDWLIPESAFLQLIDFVLKIGSSRKNVGEIACGSPFREHGREDFQPQVLLVAQSVRTALDDADLVVEALDEAKRDLVLGPAISGDPIPMTLDHLSELLVRLEALPLEARLPVVEETPRPAFPLVAPQLAEGFFQQVGGIEPLVGGQQGLQRLPAVRGQILVAGQQDVLLTLDVAPTLPCNRAYSALRTLSRASFRCRITWNLSNRMAAWGARRAVTLRKGFHLSITASRMPWLFLSPSHS